MTEVDTRQDRELAGPMSLSWETLPELAKDRWEQAVAFDMTVETHLAKAKASRTQAEIERQRVAKEILEATKEICKTIIADGKRSLAKARHMESESEGKLLESQKEWERSQAFKAEAETFSEMVMAEARLRAEDLLHQSRATAEQESMEIKQQATMEAQRMLAQAEAIRGAAKEELETQRIYTDTARLRAESHGILTQLMEELAEPEAPPVEGINGHTLPLELPEELREPGQDIPASIEVVGPAEDDSQGSANGKKTARRSRSDD